MNKQQLLSEAEVDAIVMTIPSIVKRANMMSHLAVTKSRVQVLSSPDSGAQARREVAAWLSQHPAYVLVAKCIQEGQMTGIPPEPANFASERAALQAEIEQLSAANAALRTASEGPTVHPKPWALRRVGGVLQYFDNRKEARNAQAPGEIVVDCRSL